MSQLRTTIYWAALTLPLAACAPASAQPSPAASFESRWRVTLAGPPAAPAAFDDTRAYVPLENGTISALLLEDGQVVWNAPAETAVAPAAGQARVFVATGRDVRALDAASGREVWRITLETRVATALLFDAGWLFAGLDGGRVAALRAADGAVIWSIQTGAPLQAPAAPAGDRVYLPLADGRVLAVALQTGDLVWTRALPGAPSAILPLDDRLFVGSADNFFYCLSPSDGKNRWRVRTGGDITGAPIVDESRVYFMSLDNLLRGLDRRNGWLRWQRPVPARAVGGPLWTGPFVVIATLTSQLHAFHRVTGAPAGSSPLPAAEGLESLLIAPPGLVMHQGREGFVLLTRQGVLQLVGYADSGTSATGPVASPAAGLVR